MNKLETCNQANVLTGQFRFTPQCSISGMFKSCGTDFIVEELSGEDSINSINDSSTDEEVLIVRQETSGQSKHRRDRGNDTEIGKFNVEIFFNSRLNELRQMNALGEAGLLLPHYCLPL